MDKQLTNLEPLEDELSRVYTPPDSRSMVYSCSSEEDGETRRSRIDVGGKGKLDLVAQVTELGDSRDSGGGDIGNWIGETGATC